MIYPFPSNDGPSIPKHRHEQLDVLRQMFGEPEPPTAEQHAASSLLDGLELRAFRVLSGPTFTPTPGTCDDTRRPGRLFWLPPKLTPMQKMGWHRSAKHHNPNDQTDPRTIHILITHAALDGSRRPRTAAACATLRDEVARYGAALGVYTVTIDQPQHAWTLDTLKDFAFLMDALLPGTDHADRDKTRFYVTAHKLLEVSRCGTNDADVDARYIARIQFFGADNTTRDWCHAFGTTYFREPPRQADHLLNEIDALQLNAATTPPAPPINVDAGLDDDLDDIEKAARDALHGKKLIPLSSQSLELSRKIELLAQRSPAAVAMLSGVLDALLRPGGA